MKLAFRYLKKSVIEWLKRPFKNLLKKHPKLMEWGDKVKILQQQLYE